MKSSTLLKVLSLVLMMAFAGNVQAQFGKKLLDKAKKATNIKQKKKKSSSETTTTTAKEKPSNETTTSTVKEKPSNKTTTSTTKVAVAPSRVSRYIGRGTSRADADIIYNIDNDGYVYKGMSNQYASDVICGLYKGQIYKGTSQYASDVICNIGKDGAVYKGTSDYVSDIVFHFNNNGMAAYRKTSTHSSEIIFRYDKDGYVYRGNSDYASDVIFNINGKFTKEEIVAIWVAIEGL